MHLYVSEPISWFSDHPHWPPWAISLGLVILGIGLWWLAGAVQDGSSSCLLPIVIFVLGLACIGSAIKEAWFAYVKHTGFW